MFDEVMTSSSKPSLQFKNVDVIFFKINDDGVSTNLKHDSMCTRLSLKGL